ncbi:uncharacterized protein JCM6883_000390 [Sporobolomyces salmoneus]|uniref:uncharacterized protein n=1 Tax=Sporobolomyces salmoneus TaxID=183962 RepID=UPI003172462A
MDPRVPSTDLSSRESKPIDDFISTSPNSSYTLNETHKDAPVMELCRVGNSAKQCTQIDQQVTKVSPFILSWKTFERMVRATCSSFLPFLLLLFLRPTLLVSAQSTITSAASSSSTSNTTDPNSIRTSIILPPLYSCSPSSWVYTAPVGPKYLGFFLSGTNSFIETYALPEAYNARTNGTFIWNCDLPPGLSVAAMFYVIQDGAPGTNGHQTTTTDALVNSGTSHDQCYGQNDPGAQRGILSLASSLDPSFTFTADPANSTNGNRSGGNSNDSKSTTPVGAIIGGVLGGLALIILLILLLIYLRRKHDQANGLLNDGASVYSGWTEKTRRENAVNASKGFGGGGNTLPPPGTYYATDPEGNTILVMGQPPHPSSSPPILHNSPATHQDGTSEIPLSPPAQSLYHGGPQPSPPVPVSSPPGGGNVPKMTAPMGTLPEPMGDDEAPPRQHYPQHRPNLLPTNSIATSTGLESYRTAQNTPRAFEPQSERDGFFDQARR